MGLGPIGRMRRREVPRRAGLAPVDENLSDRPAILLRLRRRRRPSPGPATAWWLRRGDSAPAACPARNLMTHICSASTRAGSQTTTARRAGEVGAVAFLYCGGADCGQYARVASSVGLKGVVEVDQRKLTRAYAD